MTSSSCNLLSPRLALALISALVALASPCAFATDLVFPGIHPKTGAGAGQTISRGPAALFYNPANLIYTKKFEPSADVSFASVTYTYQHTDTEQYEPAVVKVNAPPVTAGASVRIVPSFAVGVAILPTASGAVQSIENVPVTIQDVYQTVNIENKQEGMKIAAGAAFRIGHPFTIGAGLIQTSEKTQTIITPAEREEPLIDVLYGGAWSQFIVGARSELWDRKFVLGLSYKSAVTKTYEGDILFDLEGGDPNADYEAFEGAGYLPATIGFGAETRIGIFGVFFDYVREIWSAGSLVAKRGFPNDPEGTDYVDTNNFAVGAKIWPWKRHMLTAAFSMQGANVGDGTPIESEDDTLLTQDEGEDEETDERLSGVSFGNLEAVPRTIFAGGYRYKLTGHGYLQAGGQYQMGSRIVPEGFAGEGQYTLSVMMVSVGLAFGF